MVYKAYSKTLLARTLNLRANKFSNLSKNLVLVNIAKFTVITYNKTFLFAANEEKIR